MTLRKMSPGKATLFYWIRNSEKYCFTSLRLSLSLSISFFLSITHAHTHTRAQTHAHICILLIHTSDVRPLSWWMGLYVPMRNALGCSKLLSSNGRRWKYRRSSTNPKASTVKQADDDNNRSLLLN